METIRHYYRELRRIHNGNGINGYAMPAARALRQARIWVAAGHMGIEFYED